MCPDTILLSPKHNYKTKVLPASLTNIDETMMLAGVDHITIAPALLRELAATPVKNHVVQSLFDKCFHEGDVPRLMEFADYESVWRMAFTRSGKGEGERKLSQVCCENMLFGVSYAIGTN